MARGCSTRALNSVDLPALGRPASTMVPQRVGPWLVTCRRYPRSDVRKNTYILPNLAQGIAVKRALLTVLLASWLVPALEAQTLRSKFVDLFSFGTCGRPLCLDGSINAQNGHGDHFITSAVAGNAAIFSFIPDAV